MVNILTSCCAQTKRLEFGTFCRNVQLEQSIIKEKLVRDLARKKSRMFDNVYS